MVKFLLLLMCVPSFAVQNVSSIKDTGFSSSLQILNCKGIHEYGAGWGASSSHLGSGINELTLHIGDAEDDTEAIAMLSAIALPTSTSSLLAITINVGTYLVDDVTNITADASDLKTVRVDVEIDDTSGDLEIIAYEKTTGEYGVSPQAGNSLCTTLKQYTVPALGTTLVELTNDIL